VTAAAPEDLGYLLGRLQMVERRVRELVGRRRAVDPAPDDPFRGLYLSDEAADAAGGRRPGR